MPGYQRVLLKLSGEVFGGGKVGIDPDVVQEIAREIAAVTTSGAQIAVVTGGSFGGCGCPSRWAGHARRPVR